MVSLDPYKKKKLIIKKIKYGLFPNFEIISFSKLKRKITIEIPRNDDDNVEKLYVNLVISGCIIQKIEKKIIDIKLRYFLKLNISKQKLKKKIIGLLKKTAFSKETNIFNIKGIM